MITGEIKNKIDGIWNTFFSAGITSPLTVLEQMTYLLFIKLLDDSQLKKEANAKMFGVEVKDAVFKTGDWLNPETNKEVPYNDLRWSVFKNFDTSSMLSTVRNDVFVFIQNI
ncbi:MAG: type I restriction-modification system subunit M N-terminal domain-containing protein, partial [Paludibacter sp.]